MFERYTDSAKRAIYFARFEALHRGVSTITPEDILLGLTWDAQTRADRVGGTKENAVALRAATGIPHRPITAIPYNEQRDLPLSKESKRVIRHAALEADEEMQFFIDTDHLLRALLRERTSTSLAIERFGISLADLRSAAAHDRGEVPPQKAPWYWKPPFLRSPAEWRVAVAIAIIALVFAFGILRSLLRS